MDDEEGGRYLFSVADARGEVYECCVADGAGDIGGWSGPAHDLSMAYAKFVMAWRMDGEALSDEETAEITGSVRDHMHEHMGTDGPGGPRKGVNDTVLQGGKIVVAAYDDLKLPPGRASWKDFADRALDKADFMVKGGPGQEGRILKYRPGADDGGG